MYKSAKEFKRETGQKDCSLSAIPLRKRKQSTNNESNLTSISKKQAQIKEALPPPTNKPTSPKEMRTPPEKMSQSLPKQFNFSEISKSTQNTKDQQVTSSFVNEQTMKFERIGELNNPQKPPKQNDRKDPSMEC